MPYVEDTLEDLNAAKNNDVRLYCQPIPKHYQKVSLPFYKHYRAEIEFVTVVKGYYIRTE